MKSVSFSTAIKSPQMLMQNGFTLIELVMVIVLLGILAATAIPRFSDMSGDAEKASVQQFVGALNSAANIAFSKFVVCGHYYGQANNMHLATFIRLDGNPANDYAACPDVFDNGAAHSIDVISQRNNLLQNPGDNMMVDNVDNGDHMQFVTKTGRTIDIIFDPATRTATWTASPAY